MPDDTTTNVNLNIQDEALREVQRQIEDGLESARRGELLDGEAVMQELRRLSARRRAHGARDVDALF